MGMTPNWRPPRGGLAADAPGISRISPGLVVSSPESPTPCCEASAEAVSSGGGLDCGRGGAFLWLTGLFSHVRLHMTMISRSGPKSRATAYDASAEGTTRSPPTRGKTRPPPGAGLQNENAT